MNALLSRKVDAAISLIQKTEPLALQYSDEGFYVAFSGGKDSQVLLELVKMAGVRYTAHMQVTTVDPPELMKFVRTEYKEVVMHRAALNMYDLIRKKKMLPMRHARFCCAYLKEQSGAGTVTLLGVRRQESSRRAKRNEVEIFNHKFSGTLDQFNAFSETHITCVGGKDKVLVLPILQWTDKDVWAFIRERALPYCSLYEQQHRIGCLFCPMAQTKQKIADYHRYPGVVKAYIKAIQYLIDNHGYCNSYKGITAEQIFLMWIRNKFDYSVVYQQELFNE
jgi:phosphoadenosine phosphosulfate reductase